MKGEVFYAEPIMAREGAHMTFAEKLRALRKQALTVPGKSGGKAQRFETGCYKMGNGAGHTGYRKHHGDFRFVWRLH